MAESLAATEPATEDELKLDWLRNKLAAAAIALGLNLAGGVVDADYEPNPTQHTSHMLLEECGDSGDWSDLEELATRNRRAVWHEDPQTAADNNRESTDKPKGSEVISIDTFNLTQQLQLPDYPVRVNLFSDVAMQLDSEAVQELLLWPYQNSHLLAEGSLERRTIECDYKFIKAGGLDGQPFNLFLPGRFYEACMIDGEVITPVPNRCKTGGRQSIADLAEMLSGLPRSRTVITTGSSNYSTDTLSPRRFNSRLLHEFIHHVDRVKRKSLKPQEQSLEVMVCNDVARSLHALHPKCDYKQVRIEANKFREHYAYSTDALLDRNPELMATAVFTSQTMRSLLRQRAAVDLGDNKTASGKRWLSGWMLAG